MKSRLLHPVAIAAVLPLVAIAMPADAAPTRRTAPPAAASKPVVADNSIIPLPLTPVVPAAQHVCAGRTPSGLGYTMLRQGTGTKPAATDTVLVNYIGYLATSGTVFDQGMRSPLSLDGVIPGFSQGLQLVARTGVVRLCIPAALGYGAQASGPIPPNADLVFQIELLDFKTAAELETLRGGQAAPAASDKDAPPRL